MIGCSIKRTRPIHPNNTTATRFLHRKIKYKNSNSNITWVKHNSSWNLTVQNAKEQVFSLQKCPSIAPCTFLMFLSGYTKVPWSTKELAVKLLFLPSTLIAIFHQANMTATTSLWQTQFIANKSSTKPHKSRANLQSLSNWVTASHYTYTCITH